MAKRLLLRILALSAILCLTLLALGPTPAHMQGPYSVAILVVDDFSGVELSTLDADPDDTCAVSLESQAFAVRGVSADPIPDTHGELVYAEIEELLLEVGASTTIDLVPVDIQGLTTAEAADAIADAITTTEADYYVLNMSFVIIPCEYIPAFADFETQLAAAQNAKDLKQLKNLFKRAVIFYDDTVFPVMSHKVQTTTDLDPLQTLFTSRSATVIPVASAGNFGLDFPFWPGAWAQVISVSGSTGEGFYAPEPWDKKDDDPLLKADLDLPNKKNRISNFGEVMLPGEYDSVSGLLTGTSFAAPRLSVAMALYVSQVGGGVCRNAQNGPALAYGDWDNLDLLAAVQEYCPAMETYLP